MPICGEKTKGGKQCQRRVSEAGQSCYLHGRTQARALWRRAFTVCETIATISGTAEGLHWVFQHSWPHIEPIWQSGLFCPENFWWDSLALPIRQRESHAEIHSKLEVALERMRKDRARIEKTLNGYSDANRKRVAEAYDKVVSELPARYRNLANALPP